MDIHDRPTMLLPAMRTFQLDDWPPKRRVLLRLALHNIKGWLDIGTLDDEDKKVLRDVGLTTLYAAVILDAVLALVVILVMGLCGLLVWHLVS